MTENVAGLRSGVRCQSENRHTFRRNRSIESESHELAGVGQFRGSAKRLLTEEEWLVHLDRPIVSDPARRRVHLGIHANDDVTLFEAQPKQGLEPVRERQYARIGEALDDGIAKILDKPEDDQPLPETENDPAQR